MHQNSLFLLELLFVAAFVFARPSVAVAEETHFAPPLPLGNRTPFTLVSVAPNAPDYTLAQGLQQWSVQFDLSSHSLIETKDDATIELDGETSRLAFGWQYRPTARLIISAELPLIAHNGGNLDSLIDRWHAITGLPDGERDRQPQDRLLFGFDDDQRVVINRRQRSVGDIVLSAAYQLSTTYPSSSRLATNSQAQPSGAWLHNTWVQFGVKLPSGRINTLSGSEATDVTLSLHHNRQFPKARRPVALSVDAYLIHTGNSTLIRPQHNVQAQLSVKIAQRWTQSVVPEIQLRYRTATYDSPLTALGSDSLGVDFGVTLLTKRGYVKVGLSEDLDIDSAPDVGFYVQFTRR